MRDLIFVSLEDWDDVWRRNQFLCATLARRYPEMKILFVGLPRNVTRSVRDGNLKAFRGETTWTVPEYPNITVTRGIKFLPETFALGRLVNDAAARRHVAGMARALGMKKPLLWLNPYSALHMAGAMDERAVIYDITDDWPEAASFTPAMRKVVTAQDQALCKRADLVIVCSQSLFDSRKPICRRILLLPNGVDCAHYATIGAPPRPGRWAHPVLGYTGTIHGDRFDVDLVAGLAGRYRAGSVVLVGPALLTAAEKSRLADCGNVHFTGPVPYSRIPAEMTEFDICIVPHLENKFTNSLNPLKLWEYLAAGRPIVSTNVAGFRDFPELCRVVTGGDAFAAACEGALAENGTHEMQRRAVAREHSWERRVDELIEQLAQAGLN